MTKDALRIVYMGTPEFAVASLRALVEGGYNVVGVVTMPDKPVGRHQSTLQASPVKEYALSVGLPVLQPERLKDETFVEALRALRPDLGVVVAFRMLPEVVWALPRLGTFNLHAALLPQYRGAAPINWAIINGDTETGVTTFFLDHQIDTGRIIHRVPSPIHDEDCVEDVYERLMTLGAEVVCRTIDDVTANCVHPVEQAVLAEGQTLRPAPKLFKENCRIDWSAGVKRCYDFVRGLSPYPAAWTELVQGDKHIVLKVYRTAKEPDSAAAALPVGTLVAEGKRTLKVALADGYLHLLEVQPAGGKRLKAEQYLCSFRRDVPARLC